ncbi:UNVERIFIED_CONTAM: ATP-binding cassette subfamily B protein [Acetivibrio alkalicellulosi]
MKRFGKYLKKYWKGMILAPLMMMIEVLADILHPFIMAQIVDNGITTGDTVYIVRMGFLMLILVIVGVGGGIGCTVFASNVSQRFGADVRMDVFKKIQSFSFYNLDKYKTSSLITRLTNDVTQLQHVVMMMLRIMVRAPLLCLGGIFMAFRINAGLASIIIIIIPVLLITMFVLVKKVLPLFTAVQQKLDSLNSVIRENLTGIRVVKAFVRSDYENKRFADTNDEFVQISINAWRRIALAMPILFFLMNITVCAVIWFGAFKVNSGDMQIGQVMAFVNYMVQILFALMMVAYALMMISRGKASFTRIGEILGEQVSNKNGDVITGVTIDKGSISFENVSFTYKDSETPAISNISFSAKSGETVAILGATGSGKSTLVNLIPRFYEVTEGRILIDNKDSKNIDLVTLRKGISMVLQETILFSGTIIDNIRWGKEDASEEEVIEAAKAAQAYEFICKFPQGFNTVLGQRGVNVSGGQKQRLAIARAIINKPPILILDDSTSAVDTATELKLQTALKENIKNTTCIVIAQRISTVLEADKIIVLENGKIVSMGSHLELLNKSDVYRDIYHSQLGEEAV